LREAAACCRGCDLYKDATQTVFGEGAAHAKVMLVGEQPGDSEDREGHPFVGPAGKLLRRAMDEAGIAPRDVYITNAVKHFKYIWRGKRRIHNKPKVIEVRACRPWLEAEISVVQPEIVVALGATAAQTLLGSAFRLTAHRGEVVVSDLAPRVIATVHPSSILRAPDDDARHVELAEFIGDLKKVARTVYGVVR
jgi:DNA polymerase